MTENVVEIRDLRVNFTKYEGIMKVLDGVNLSIKKGEMLGLVGETGCGKTMTGRAIMRILPSNAQIMSGGKIFFEGSIDLLNRSEEEMRKIRGKIISLIFQEPRRALHPTFNVGGQIAEIFSLHMKAQPVSFADRSVRRFDQCKGWFPRGDGHCQAGTGFIDAIADNKDNLFISPGSIVVRRPGKYTGRWIERCTRREIVDPKNERITVGIKGGNGEFDCLAFSTF